MRLGFTLIELSIVIVVIGFIIGGIVLGRDLVAGAAIRATVGQVERYNAAVHTFSSRYGGLPGDLHMTQASAYGLFALNIIAAGGGGSEMGVGNGNGQVELLDPGAPLRAFSGEVPVFWRHLSDTGLIEGQFGVSDQSRILPFTGHTVGPVNDMSQSMPTARAGSRSSFAVYSAEGLNFYEINSFFVITSTGSYRVRRPGLMASEAQALDVKMDDGWADSGVVIARGAANLNGALNQAPDSYPSATMCVLDPAAVPVEYALTQTSPSCALRVDLGKH